MKKVKGQPITGTNVQMSKRKPFVPNAKDTSAAAQTDIAAAPMPFKNRMETPQMPAPAGPRGSVPGQEPKNIYAGKSGSVAPANPQGSAVGYSKLPNQSKQIGGRTSVAPTPRKVGSVSGFSRKKGAAFYGE